MMQHMRDVVGSTTGSSMLTQPKTATAPSATDSHELSRKQAVRIAVKTKGGTLFIGSADVLAVVAQGNYVLLVRESGSHHLRESISVMEEELKAYGFVRIHRSVLVNKVWVDEIRPYAPRKYLLRLKNGKEFTVTRTYKGNLKSLGELWLGNDTFQGG
ncbi:MAG: LytR/AlgR family response regulator transcription factor [Candidatus Acidiferrales bacterium]